MYEAQDLSLKYYTGPIFDFPMSIDKRKAFIKFQIIWRYFEYFFYYWDNWHNFGMIRNEMFMDIKFEQLDW